MCDDFDAVLPMGRWCRSYRIGHRVHWIQGLRSAGTTVVIRVSVAVHPSGLVQLRGDDLSLECWNHTAGAIRASLPRNPDRAVVWGKPEWHVLIVPPAVLANEHNVFNLAAADESTECLSATPA